jgi:hypothetical protein
MFSQTEPRSESRAQHRTSLSMQPKPPCMEVIATSAVKRGTTKKRNRQHVLWARYPTRDSELTARTAGSIVHALQLLRQHQANHSPHLTTAAAGNKSTLPRVYAYPQSQPYQARRACMHAAMRVYPTRHSAARSFAGCATLRFALRRPHDSVGIPVRT